MQDHVPREREAAAPPTAEETQAAVTPAADRPGAPKAAADGRAEETQAAVKKPAADRPGATKAAADGQELDVHFAQIPCLKRYRFPRTRQATDEEPLSAPAHQNLAKEALPAPCTTQAKHADAIGSQADRRAVDAVTDAPLDEGSEVPASAGDGGGIGAVASFAAAAPSQSGKVAAQPAAAELAEAEADAADGRLSAARRCPRGHQLSDRTTTMGGTCDGCGNRVKQGQHVTDCRTCNWYLCSACCRKDPAGAEAVESEATSNALPPRFCGIRPLAQGASAPLATAHQVLCRAFCQSDRRAQCPSGHWLAIARPRGARKQTCANCGARLTGPCVTCDKGHFAACVRCTLRAAQDAGCEASPGAEVDDEASRAEGAPMSEAG